MKEENQELEQRTLYFHCQIGPDEIEILRNKILKEQRVIIREAYFGRHPTPGPVSTRCPVGLNLIVDYKSWGSAGATYTKMEDVDRLMDDLNVQRTEEMVGKEVTAYLDSQRLVAISKLEQPEDKPKLTSPEARSLLEAGLGE